MCVCICAISRQLSEGEIIIIRSCRWCSLEFFFCQTGAGNTPPLANLPEPSPERDTLIETRRMWSRNLFMSPWGHKLKPSLSPVRAEGVNVSGSHLRETSDQSDNQTDLSFQDDLSLFICISLSSSFSLLFLLLFFFVFLFSSSCCCCYCCCCSSCPSYCCCTCSSCSCSSCC